MASDTNKRWRVSVQRVSKINGQGDSSHFYCDAPDAKAAEAYVRTTHFDEEERKSIHSIRADSILR